MISIVLSLCKKHFAPKTDHDALLEIYAVLLINFWIVELPMTCHWASFNITNPWNLAFICLINDYFIKFVCKFWIFEYSLEHSNIRILNTIFGLTSVMVQLNKSFLFYISKLHYLDYNNIQSFMSDFTYEEA